MPAPNFYSVERKGYTKVSDLFADVMKDMIDYGFTLVNSSHGYPLSIYKPSIDQGGEGHTVGEKLYIFDGTRPEYNQNQRPAPYVVVTKVTSSPDGTTTGIVSELSEVFAAYDYPIWTEEPTGSINLKSDTNEATDVFVTLASVSSTLSGAVNSGISTIATTANVPSVWSFTLEAGPDVDPWNGSINPVAIPERAIEEYEKQPWRVQFKIDGEQQVSGAAATKLQMAYDEATGKIKISQITDDKGVVIDNVGVFGAVQTSGVYVDSNLDQAFYNRKVRVANTPQTFPLSYILSITNRGFFLGIYEGTWSTVRAATTVNSNYFNWVLVQRPVDRNDGKTLLRGKAPVFCLNSVNYKYYKSIVREADILHPTAGPSPTLGTGNITVSGSTSLIANQWRADSGTPTTIFTDELQYGSTIYDRNGNIIGVVKSVQDDETFYFENAPKANINNQFWYYTPPNVTAYRTRADAHSPDSHMIFNSSKQVALTEDKTYLLSFPHNLTTSRFRYTEELDMIGTTSADVVMSGQVIQFTTYGETGPRTYKALPPGGAFNTGLRLSVLWAPTGPTWVTPNAGSLGDIHVDDVITVTLTASPVPQPYGEAAWATPTFSIASGNLPSGLELVFIEEEQVWRITGTVAAAEYTETTKIKFTIAANNVENSGYALRDFWFTYVPS